MNWIEFKKDYEQAVLEKIKKHFPELNDCPMRINWDTMKFSIENIPGNFKDETHQIIAHQNKMLSKVRKPN